MHIKHIHCMIEKLSECAKCEIENKGIENVDTEEMGKVVYILKDLCKAEYYAKISKAMDEAEEDDEEDGRKYYRGQPRDSRGRYMSNRGRRGYEEPMMYYTMTPEMMRAHDPEYWRDMDRMTEGRMYYTGNSGSSSSSVGGMSGGMSGGQSGSSRNYGGESGGNRYYEDYSAGQRDSREGRSGQSRKSYMETKEMHKGNTPEDKQKKMKELEKYMSELSGDVTEMISDASPEEKSMLKNKMQVLMQKI